MISKKLEKMLNEQVKNEFYSAYLYLSMAAHLDSKDLKGFANWYYVQVKEERDHAMMMLDYLLRVGGKAALPAIDAPTAQFRSTMEILKMTLEHEQLVTKLIYELMDEAVGESDYKTIAFLQWYVTEQAEEEENAQNLISRMKLAETSQSGLLFMDNELAQRKYKPAKMENGLED